MQGGIRRGLHIDDDDQVKKPDEYGGIDPSRKRGNFERNLDDMLFGGGMAPARRRPTAEKKQQVNTSKTKDVVKPAETKVETNTAKAPQSVKVSPNTSGNIKKQPSIVVPTEEKKPKEIEPIGSIGIISSTQIKAPQVNNYVDPKNSGRTPNQTQIQPQKEPVQPKPQPVQPQQTQPSQPTQQAQSTQAVKPVQPAQTVQPTQPAKPVQPAQTVQPNQPTQPTEVSKPAVKPAENPQPVQQFEEVTLEVLHPFSNKNKFNKPGFLRKGKKVAEDFKFADENVVQNTAVDVVKPFQTDRTRQRKLNDFDFHDFQFPATSASLGLAHKDTPSVWKKPQELAKTINFGKYVDPNDLQPGTLSSPHFLSALSGISELEANTKRLIEDQKTNSNGFYLVRLFVNSVWRYIAVDSTLPHVNGENAGVLGNVEGGELDIYSSLIEKAYAKSFSGYDVFSKTHPRQNYLRDLTGSPVKKYSLDTPDLQNIVKKALASGQVVQAVPTEKIAALGVNPNFSYTVVNYSAKGSFELRNSWGTLEQRSKTSFRAEGNFQIPAGIVRDNISHLLITRLNPAYFTSTIQTKHRLGFYSTYNFKVRNDTHGFLTVSQWDDRLFPACSNYSYSPASIILQKNGATPEFISANHTTGLRNLDLQVQLSPGDYTVFVALNWKHQEHNFNLTFYGSQRVDFSRVYNEKNPNHITQSLESWNLSNGKRVDTSKTSAQFTSYHAESNLILITVENTSNRQGRATVDLTRAKLENVTLISGHNNEENYSQKVGYEIEEYKQAPLSDKRWTVNLEAGHRFTWVLASKEAYSQGNARAWGFL